MFIDVYWCLLMFIDVYWCLLMFFDVFWCLLMFIDVYWCLLMFIDVYWCLLMFIESYVYFLFLSLLRFWSQEWAKEFEWCQEKHYLAASMALVKPSYAREASVPALKKAWHAAPRDPSLPKAVEFSSHVISLPVSQSCAATSARVKARPGCSITTWDECDMRHKGTQMTNPTAAKPGI